MADDAAQQEAGAQDGVDTAFDGEFDADRAKALIEKLRAENKGLKSFKNEAAPKISEYDKLVAASQSELDRAMASAKEFEQRAAAAELARDRNAVALAKGLTPAQAKRLVGSNLDELTADADDLLQDFPTPAEARAPRADRSQASSGNNRTASSPADEFAAFITKQRAG